MTDKQLDHFTDDPWNNANHFFLYFTR